MDPTPITLRQEKNCSNRRKNSMSETQLAIMHAIFTLSDEIEYNIYEVVDIAEYAQMDADEVRSVIQNLYDEGYLGECMTLGDDGFDTFYLNRKGRILINGEIFPETLNEAEAMELLLSNPILIRRPLMIIGTEKMCGFDEKKVSEILDRYVEPMPKINCMEKGCLEKK
jgi:arsenate reductase-like glutaredoxin family protein